MQQINYFGVANAIHEHDSIINKSGGLHGIKNIGMLDSLLTHIQNNDYYPTFQDKLTHVVFALIQHHIFNDGNKRSSLALGAYFLCINGKAYAVRYFIHKMENIVVWVAEGKISKVLLGKILSYLIELEDYSEEVKLEILEAVS